MGTIHQLIMSDIDQLNQAKQLVIQNPSSFTQVLEIILPIANQSSDLKINQWCSTFFNEFTSPESKVLSFYQKQDTSSRILPTLIHYSKINDVLIFKNVVLTATNIYDMILDLVAKTSNGAIWQDFDMLKKFIISQWSTTYPLTSQGEKEIDEQRSIGSKLTILKFISKIIVLQTANNVSKDPRRSTNSSGSTNGEISIANISESHSVINKNVLDAEAQGLLDLLLNYLSEEEYLIPQKFIGILNALIIILQKRYQLFHVKVFNSIVNFQNNLDKKYQFSKDSNLKSRLSRRYIDRYMKNLLNYCIKSSLLNPSNPIYNRATKIITDINSQMESQKKRGILNPDEDSQPQRKKIKLENPPLQPSLNSIVTNDNNYSSLYRLIESSNELCQFDISQIPQSTLSNIAIATLLNIDTNKLISALSLVSARYADLVNKSPPPPPPSAPPSGNAPVKEALDDTERDDQDNNQILSQNDQDDANLETTYVLPPPATLSLEEKKKHLRLIIENFFKISTYKVDTSNTAPQQEIENSVKINKIAISQWSKNSWLVILTRLATRGLANGGESEEENEELSDLIRESIFQYFLQNIHERIDIIIEWLNEEWYSEFNKNFKDDEQSKTPETPTYLKWTEKTLETLIPFLESNDRKLFIRLLSDLPFLNESLVLKLKSLCIDPERSSLGFQSLQFLVMFKPPVKNYCFEILKDLYENNEDLKSNALGLLKKYLPEEYGDKE